MHYNLGKTLQDVENIVALPQQAAEAEDMLKDDTQLSEVLPPDSSPSNPRPYSAVMLPSTLGASVFFEGSVTSCR